MIEKVNPSHPDKIADRIAGAIVDLAYKQQNDPKIAVEVLVGHEECHIIVETSLGSLPTALILDAVNRIAGRPIDVDLSIYPQDEHLAENQTDGFRCGDNGIFKGMPLTKEQKTLSSIARSIYEKYPYDGKYVFDSVSKRLIICQSNAKAAELKQEYLSKADVSVNIYAFLKAQQTGKPVELFCAIGDDMIDGKPYGEIVEQARQFIQSVGGFEAFAEWGLY